jgi:transposase
LAKCELAGNEAGTQVPLSVCYEIGYDGFRLARYLIGRGIDTHVLDSSSFRVSRRGRRAKTDRIDVEAMAITLRAFRWRPRRVPGSCHP